MVGVMLAMGAERSATWLGSVGPVEVGVFVAVDPDPLSWIWTGILVGGATMLCYFARRDCIRRGGKTKSSQSKARLDGQTGRILGYAGMRDVPTGSKGGRRRSQLRRWGETGPDRHHNPTLPSSPPTQLAGAIRKEPTKRARLPSWVIGVKKKVKKSRPNREYKNSANGRTNYVVLFG